MYVLDYDRNGFVRYWIDKDDPVHGFSLWKRKARGDSVLIKNVPAKYRKIYNQLKGE